MSKVRVATTWFDNCSGCHMSLLDIDDKLIELTDKIELVYGPLVDTKEYPENVDVVLIEGGLASNEDIEKIKKIRARTKIVVSLGDCAVTGNVPAMRNLFPLSAVFDRAYKENAQVNAQRPQSDLPVLCDQVRPVHEIIKVDVFVPGCPPPPQAILFAVGELLEGRIPNSTAFTRFGQ